ncbi:TCR gamma alternate reading frame protein [Orycteropus afer afer]|uniref:TCR gamma alternate reading frame protein n=1 Tax=Orycteropus afer afer TaxID=1230840 RepID=UPI001C5CA5B6|nr:TCR gamma alternate reading frame protein [Orycteropus afer afer]
MLWYPTLLLVFLAPASQKASNLKMRSVTKETGTSVMITCDILDQKINYIHWYRYQEGKALQRLLYYNFPKKQVVVDSGFRAEKYTAYEGLERSCKFVVRNVEKSDSGVYYCATWDMHRWIKIFGEGTKLIVTPFDKSLSADLSPKPTIFLPSVAEINHHSAGTYLCLLEKFFPDVIKVDWKEKNNDRILESQQGDTIKTNDTFMKYSWLTVTGESLNKEHQCVVKHEKVKEGDQMILFPPIRTAFIPPDATKTCWKDESDVLQLQFTNTSAYYTYLLLLLKSIVYLAIIVFCLLRRTAVCGDGKTL